MTILMAIASARKYRTRTDPHGMASRRDVDPPRGCHPKSCRRHLVRWGSRPSMSYLGWSSASHESFARQRKTLELAFAGLCRRLHTSDLNRGLW